MQTLSLCRSLASLAGILLAIGAVQAQALQAGQIVEVNAYGSWDVVGKVLRSDSSGILVLYRSEDGSYNERTGFSRYFKPGDVRPANAISTDAPTDAAAPVDNASLASANTPTVVGAFSIGERVQGWNIDWYDGTVVKIGSASYAGYYLIKHDKFAQDSYYAEANMRRLSATPPNKLGQSNPAPPPDAAPVADTSTARGPRAGSYGCGVFLSGRYTLTQTITFDGSRYRTNLGEGGSYSYDKSIMRLNFQGGALANHVGQYEPDNNAIIRLTQRSDLSQSSYTQKWRSQICSPR